MNLQLIKKIANPLAIVSVILYFIEVGIGLDGKLPFIAIERCIALFFTFELWLQLRHEKQYIRSAEFIIDVLSILPFYVGFFIVSEHHEYIRTLRVLRLFKLFWNNEAFEVMKHAFVLAWPSIKNVGVCLGCVVLFCAAILFQAEKETFGNIGNALYFVCTTVTTIGFGDFSPKTPLGKFITVFLLYGPAVMVCGSLVGVVCSSYQASLERFRKIALTNHTDD